MSSVDSPPGLHTIEVVDLSEIGEWGLIESIREKLKLPSNETILVDIGDDAACVRLAGLALLTIDSYLEAVHFQPTRYSYPDIGYRCLAASVSDVAAMGGRPRFALVSLQIPGHTKVGDVAALYSGMIEIASTFDFRIVGGDTVRSERLGVTCAIVGEAETVIERRGAQVGDSILVTGNLGASSLGLRLMNEKIDSTRALPFIKAHKKPTPRIKEGLILGSSGAVTAMIDISDGLATDVHHLAHESEVGAVIWAGEIPLVEGFEEIARECGVAPLDFALYGGEDYELLFTLPEDRRSELATKVRTATGTKVTEIGTVVAESTVLLERKGERTPLARRGFDHFKSP